MINFLNNQKNCRLIIDNKIIELIALYQIKDKSLKKNIKTLKIKLFEIKPV